MRPIRSRNKPGAVTAPAEVAGAHGRDGAAKATAQWEDASAFGGGVQTRAPRSTPLGMRVVFASFIGPTSAGGAKGDMEKTDGQRRVRGWGRGLRGLLLLLLAIAAVAAVSWGDVKRSMTVFPAPDPSGPYEPLMIELETPAGALYEAASVRLFYPAVAAEDGAWPLLIYMPGFQGVSSDNDPLLRELASYGYVVAAIDDVARDRPAAPESAARAAIRRGDIDYSTLESYRASRRLLSDRAAMSADKLITVLDGLIAAAAADQLPVAVDLGRIGAIGFSFGGTAATEALVRDPRIRAAINMDGGLFGPAAPSATAQVGAYLEFRGGELPLILPGWLSWIKPSAAYLVRDHQDSYAVSDILLNRPNGRLVTIRGAAHLDFTSKLYEGGRIANWRPWRPLPVAAARAHEIRKAYILAFLRTYLDEQPHPLMTEPGTPYPEARQAGGSFGD